MHASSLENMEKCYRRYVAGSELEKLPRISVLDVGGADVNGSYRDVFSGDRFEYLGADIDNREGVSVVMEDPYKIPLDDRSVDIVLSGQMLEHCEFFWLSFTEMMRVLKPGGFLFLIAPSAGPIHQYPVDCYRFYPDAYRALARYADCELLDVWLDERGPWNDLVGIFTRKALLPRPAGSAVGAGAAGEEEAQPHFFDPTRDTGTPEEEVLLGARNYQEVLASLHGSLDPRFYLEIGVRHGASLRLARCPSLGVDPQPEIEGELPASADIVEMTSDDFFDSEEQGNRLAATPPDMTFIDGMHLFEFALRDFMNVERISAPHGLVIVDDIYPNHVAQAARHRATRAWTGDVWKLHDCLKQYRPDLFLLPLDTWPTGLLLIAGLDPANRTLWQNYNPIVRHYRSAEIEVPPAVLGRDEACEPPDAVIQGIAEQIGAARENGLSSGALVQRLKEAVASQVR